MIQLKKNELTIQKIINFIKPHSSIIHNSTQHISKFKSIVKAKAGDATFCSFTKKKGIELIASAKANLIICSIELKGQIIKKDSTILFVKNPRLSFMRCLKKFEPQTKKKGIHATAIIESRKIGKDVYIGAYCYIGKNVSIGDNTTIFGHVHIYDNCIIGNNVIINSSSVIGADGFGYEKNEKGEWEKFQHKGIVEIHDEVEIGANTCIDRGTLDSTKIGKKTRIDNLVHVAHNVQIGKNCHIVAQSFIGGSTIIGDGVHIAMGVIIRDGIKIGNNSLLGMGSVVTKDVPSNVIFVGNPAKFFKKNI